MHVLYSTYTLTVKLKKKDILFNKAFALSRQKHKPFCTFQYGFHEIIVNIMPDNILEEGFCDIIIGYWHTEIFQFKE